MSSLMKKSIIREYSEKRAIHHYLVYKYNMTDTKEENITEWNRIGQNIVLYNMIECKDLNQLQHNAMYVTMV